MFRYVLVGIGGLAGSMARYWITGLVQDATGSQFPFGTLAVNVVGSFVLGLVMTLSIERGLLDADARLLLGAGFCGGFTTMSTFAWETTALLGAGSAASGFGNVALSLGFSLGAVWAGIAVGRVV